MKIERFTIENKVLEYLKKEKLSPYHAGIPFLVEDYLKSEYASAKKLSAVEVREQFLNGKRMLGIRMIENGGRHRFNFVNLA